MPRNPSSMSYLKIVYISGSLQNLILCIMVLIIKPKNFDLTAYEDMYSSPSWNDPNKQEQKALEKQNDGEEDQICEDYVMC